MEAVFEFIIVSIYSISLLMIFLFSLGQLHLTWHYIRHKRTDPKNKNKTKPLEKYPFVTIQLPVYNELYVIERLLKSVSQLEYPREKMEVQILDDSTDATTEKIQNLLPVHKQKIPMIYHIRRKDRKGFKAGALQYGLDKAHGDLVAIFDADFVPGKDFLKNAVPHFKNPETGMVQTRWGHTNKNYSLLTKIQAFGLDAHFSIEQVGRNHAGSFINFNGTAGIWRKKCIEDAGGWSDDTLTEDLDLSYRAQLKGWKFKFLEDVVAPAELPILMSAIKSQQYRWNKGAAETARKHLGKVFSSGIGKINKMHAFMHLLNSSVFVFLFLAAILSIPMIFMKTIHPGLQLLFDLGTVFLIGFLSIGIFYWVASKNIYPENTGKYYFTMFPRFLIILMGLSLHNSIAVIEGLAGFKTPFIRTPKFNVFSKRDSWKNNVYIKPKFDLVTILEGVLGLYFLGGIIIGILSGDMTLMVFHIMLFSGFISVFYYSVKTLKYV